MNPLCILCQKPMECINPLGKSIFYDCDCILDAYGNSSRRAYELKEGDTYTLSAWFFNFSKTIYVMCFPSFGDAVLCQHEVEEGEEQMHVFEDVKCPEELTPAMILKIKTYILFS